VTDEWPSLAQSARVSEKDRRTLAARVVELTVWFYVRLRRSAGGALIDLEAAGVARVTETMLCHCGQSNNKPFCDGSHRAAGFVAAGV
jgi:CDGSH-type Zn-finger protein